VRRGIEVEMITDHFEGSSESLNYEGVNVYKKKTIHCGLSGNRWRELVYMVKVILFVLERGFDIVFLHSVSGIDCFMFPLLKLLKFANTLEITLADNDDPLAIKNRKLGGAYYWGISKAQRVVAISTRLYELSREAGIPSDQLGLIPVGVDSKKFYPVQDRERIRLKVELGLNEFDPLVLAVGALEPRKGYDYMMKAWKEIMLRYPKSRLLIAGPKNTPDNPFYNQLLEILGSELAKTVSFLGVVNNVDTLMRAADCLWHCAVNEGLPNTLVEAGMTGIPMLCRKLTGITSDVILDERIGSVCDSDSPSNFADLFETVLHKSESERFDSAALIRKRFDIDYVAGQYHKLFIELLKQNGKSYGDSPAACRKEVSLLSMTRQSIHDDCKENSFPKVEDSL
jgi:glycosyltransferase involved in cell wall biosynthesis